MTERNAGLTPITIDGAIDLHCHFGPEQLVTNIVKATHAVDPVEAALEAAAAGMRGIVLKAHEFPSTMSAYFAQKAVPDVQVFSSICMDHPVGGLNPQAAENALINGAKVVWLPTLSAHQDPPVLLERAFGVTQGLRVLDHEGEIIEEVRQIMDLVREHDAVLATGHISREEHFAIARAFSEKDRLIVTHAMQETAGPSLTAQECVELSELGAIIEFAAHSCHGKPAIFDQVVRAVTRIGAERVALSTDYGWTVHAPHPAAGFQSFINQFWAQGMSDEDLRTMTVDVPERLLGLS
ncbi:hypothetical protein JOF28_002545 [Leucobacter exalbidus]|uniref:Uncharacterized protein n=1 Tax=Leucobacter exalbidus TaxID=662960 RepID=A0A940PUZ3_9MICO|nr:DUF6282 family protein [Leucobacter exalbidus]MBP1327313.1 hypothetical protein [Leucobacter exalbidus]